MNTYYSYSTTGHYLGVVQAATRPPFSTSEIPPHVPDGSNLIWNFPGWLITSVGTPAVDIPPTPVATLDMVVTSGRAMSGRRYAHKTSDEVVVEVTITPAVTESFFLPLEKEGGETIPVPISVINGKGLVRWTPPSPGFYRVTRESVNRDLPEQYKLALQPIIIIAY